MSGIFRKSIPAVLRLPHGIYVSAFLKKKTGEVMVVFVVFRREFGRTPDEFCWIFANRDERAV
jgi:hypothetical protein